MLKASMRDDEKMGLGLVLTAIQVVAYFTYIAFCSFNSSFANGDAPAGGVPLSFYYGLAVITLGVFLTVIYVVVTNRSAVEK